MKKSRIRYPTIGRELIDLSNLSLDETVLLSRISRASRSLVEGNSTVGTFVKTTKTILHESILEAQITRSTKVCADLLMRIATKAPWSKDFMVDDLASLLDKCGLVFWAKPVEELRPTETTTLRQHTLEKALRQIDKAVKATQARKQKST